MNDHEPVIVGALRTPLASAAGACKMAPRRSDGRDAAPVGRTVRRQPSDLDDVIVGCVLQWDQQHGNLARHAVLAAGCPNPSRL